MDIQKQIRFLNWLEMEMLLMDIEKEYEKKEKLENENKRLIKSKK